MVHSHQVDETRHKKRNRDAKRERGFPIKVLPLLKGTKKIRCITQIHKVEKVVVLKVIDQFLPSAARVMRSSD